MTMLTLNQAHALLQHLPGARLVGDGNTAIARVHSDTRTLQPGDLFVALKGERFDGNFYLTQARAAGAVAALAERGLGADTLPGIEVPDALLALQTLAAAWRARCTLPLIAVTGSNGKTTVTQMVAAMLRAWLGNAALATTGNFNNHIGVPLTLLRLRPDGDARHRAAVLELGMNHPGEIAQLAALAAPSVVLVNNAQREHLEFMTSVDAVARENGSAIAALPADGTAVLPADDAFTRLWRAIAAERGVQRVLGFALNAMAGTAASESADADAEVGITADVATSTTADVTASARWAPEQQQWLLTLHTPAGDIATTLAQAGRHNLRNALAATACALAAGAPLAAVAQGLAAFIPVAGRSQLLTFELHGTPVTLVDDSYNANPDSVLAAIDLLASLPGPRWLLLGDMGEVGSDGPRFHVECGAHARNAGIDHVWSAGELSAHAGADRHFGSVAALLNALRETPTTAPAVRTVLVKGSRFMRMEQVVQALQQAGGESQQHNTGAVTDAA